MKVIGLAGGSGSGKSTVSYHLVDTYPDMFEVINFDDYQRLKTEPNLPMLEGMVNWDHPDIINWEKLRGDILNLKNGEPVTLKVWSHRSNPDYHIHGKIVDRTIQPKSIIIVEGYLALHDAGLNDLYDRTYFLELDDKTRNLRRGKGTLTGKDTYETKVLIPMHKQYVEPTKAQADVVIDVSNCSIAEVAELIKVDLEKS